jgi:hydrogenase maturation protease
MQRAPRVVIMGIGNTLLADEGIGIHVVHRLQDLVPTGNGIELLDGGTLSFNLLPAIEAADSLIVVDAARLGQAPASVRCLIGEDFDSHLGQSRHTAHEIGLRELLDMARLNGRLPSRRALIGVQPFSLDWGEKPTEAVTAAIPLIMNLALSLADQWSRSPIQDDCRG